MKPLFWNAPAVDFSLTLVPPVHQKCSDTRDDNEDRIAEHWIGGQKIDNIVERGNVGLARQQRVSFEIEMQVEAPFC